MTYDEVVHLSADEMYSIQEKGLKWTVRHAYANCPFYRRKMDEAGVTPEDIKTLADITRLPFTTPEDIRDNYPLGITAVPEKDIVRIHASSGTTGKKKVIPYTRKDLEDWAEMFSRCFKLAGLTPEDRIQVMVGYGLWTAGVGFQAGIEKFGAMAVPVGPGQTDLQLELMEDLQVTAFCATSSYALFLGEEVERRGLKPRLKLKAGIIGSERWSDRMRKRIEELLGVETFDIPGMTELYGPGTGLDCQAHEGIHYWSDYFLYEIIDPRTGQTLPPGETGELVATTLCKEAMPMIRYRTHDLTRLLPGRCSCGRSFFRTDRFLGRTDDMVKVRGVNIFQSQIDHLLNPFRELGSEYQFIIDRAPGGKDAVLLRVECRPGFSGDGNGLAETIKKRFFNFVGLTPDVELVQYGGLPRTERKTRRIFDRRLDL
ncbi:MAG: phenylacetate--CoA ligase [Armatimonadetes bacterium]|nr:phenylacetate--CoA ligase [Armatimonadota bacterium]